MLNWTIHPPNNKSDREEGDGDGTGAGGFDGQGYGDGVGYGGPFGSGHGDSDEHRRSGRGDGESKPWEELC